mmetsp:Transcript_47453/g.94737  ORF Transcript_47453/g.94737 Transcript_47453/m.94737 type:complete len:209 (-) Transcript_47453:309-935(-)
MLPPIHEDNAASGGITTFTFALTAGRRAAHSSSRCAFRCSLRPGQPPQRPPPTRMLVAKSQRTSTGAASSASDTSAASCIRCSHFAASARNASSEATIGARRTVSPSTWPSYIPITVTSRPRLTTRPVVRPLAYIMRISCGTMSRYETPLSGASTVERTSRTCLLSESSQTLQVKRAQELNSSSVCSCLSIACRVCSAKMLTLASQRC